MFNVGELTEQGRYEILPKMLGILTDIYKQELNIGETELLDTCFALCMANKFKGDNALELSVDKFMVANTQAWSEILAIMGVTGKVETEKTKALPRVQQERVIIDVMLLYCSKLAKKLNSNGLSNLLADASLCIDSSKDIKKYIQVDSLSGISAGSDKAESALLNNYKIIDKCIDTMTGNITQEDAKEDTDEFITNLNKLFKIYNNWYCALQKILSGKCTVYANKEVVAEQLNIFRGRLTQIELPSNIDKRLSIVKNFTVVDSSQDSRVIKQIETYFEDFKYYILDNFIQLFYALILTVYNSAQVVTAMRLGTAKREVGHIGLYNDKLNKCYTPVTLPDRLKNKLESFIHPYRSRYKFSMMKLLKVLAMVYK